MGLILKKTKYEVTINPLKTYPIDRGYKSAFNRFNCIEEQ